MKRILNTSALTTAIAATFAAMVPAQHSYAPPPRTGPKVARGQGAKRAAARLAAKHEANKRIPDPVGISRQVGRRMKMEQVKAYRSSQKEQAMTDKRPGGSAAVW